MRFFVIGLGSMGKRRIRNLQFLGENDIIGFDTQEKRLKECNEKYKIKTYSDIRDAIKENPDVFIISTPPDHHIGYEFLATANNKPFFCEAGVSSVGLNELIAECRKRKIFAAPSATFRFNSSVIKIKEIISSGEIGNPVSLTYHMGQYLPDWHPYENIKDFYVGKPETAATREMVPFELEWLTWIFGDISEIFCIRGKVSSLPVEINDVYQTIFRFESGVIGHLLVEVVSRTPVRSLRVVCEEGTIEWDWLEDTVNVFSVSNKKWVNYKGSEHVKENGYISKEDMYIEEIRCFIETIKGNSRYPFSLEEYLKVLKLLESAEKNS